MRNCYIRNCYLPLITTLLFSTSLSAVTLDELTQSALQSNSAIKKSELQTELMQSRQEEAKAKRMGSFDVVGSYTHYNLPRTLAPIVPSSLSPYNLSSTEYHSHRSLKIGKIF